MRLAWFARERREMPAYALEQLLYRQLPAPPFPVLQNRTNLPGERAQLALQRRREAEALADAQVLGEEEAALALELLRGALGALGECAALVVRTGDEWWIRLTRDAARAQEDRIRSAAKRPGPGPRPHAPPKVKTSVVSPVERWDRTVALALKDYWVTPADIAPEDWDVGRVTVHTRHFLRGDLVLVFYTNGQAERAPVTGYSGRGHSVTRLYMQYQRFSRSFPDDTFAEQPHSGTIRVLERPAELRGSPYASPDIRAWVSSLLPHAAGDSARGVGVGSPSLLPSGTSS